MRRDEFILGTCLYALLIAAGFAWPALEKAKWPKVDLSIPSFKPFSFSKFLPRAAAQPRAGGAQAPQKPVGVRSTSPGSPAPRSGI